MNSDKKRKSTTWEEKRSALEIAFCKLQPARAPKHSKGIPYETLITGIPRQLMLMAPMQRRKYILAPKEAMRQLALTSGRLADLIDRLPSIAVEALNFQQKFLSNLTTDLRILNCVAKSACQSSSKTVAVAAVEGGVPLFVEAREIIAAFQAMVRKKSLADLGSWLERARSSLVASFANGITKGQLSP